MSYSLQLPLAAAAGLAHRTSMHTANLRTTRTCYVCLARVNKREVQVWTDVQGSYGRHAWKVA